MHLDELVGLLSRLMAADSSVIKQATIDLNKAFQQPDTLTSMCDLVASNRASALRQYSAVLLSKRLGKLRNWMAIPAEQQQIIKDGMLATLMREEDRKTRIAVAQFIGVMVRHEAHSNAPWLAEVLKYVFQHCSSPNPVESEQGSSIFATLTDAAPDQFLPHMEMVCDMFLTALAVTEASGNMATPVIVNIIQAMTNLMPFIVGHNVAEASYQKAIPAVVKVLRAFSSESSAENFLLCFDLLDSMGEYAPKLIGIHLKMLLELCLDVASNTQLTNSMRVKCVSHIGLLVTLKKKMIVKQKFIEPVIQVVFKLMASDNGENDDEEYFLGDDEANPMSTATQTMDLLALNIPPTKLIPPLLKLLDVALKNSNPLERRAAYLSMAVMAEGCADAICDHYLEEMLKTIKMGIVDPMPVVRNAAFFALGQFSEHLQPDISKFAPEVLPILFEFLNQMCQELRLGGAEPKHIDRMFYALETFCENLGDSLLPHLAKLMECLNEGLNPNYSVRMREMSLSAISAAAAAAKVNIMPYFQQLITVLQPFLAKTDDMDIVSLRPQAIDTLAALARAVGKENFLALADDTMRFALTLLEDADDPDERRALYNLIASLAEIVCEQMAIVYPKIMERIYESVLNADEVLPDYNAATAGRGSAEEIDESADIDIDDSEDEDDDEFEPIGIENSYLDEKEEAILALKEFAEHTGTAFIPYLESSYKNVYKMIDHPQEEIRKVVIEALVMFVVVLHKHNDAEGAKNAVMILVPKLSRIVLLDDHNAVVLAALESLSQLFQELGPAALPTNDLRDSIFGGIMDLMMSKGACQFEDATSGGGDEEDEIEESEFDEAVIEGAGNLLPTFGRTMPPNEFVAYFERMYPIFLTKLEKAKKNSSMEDQRAFLYGALAECFESLKEHTAMYFKIFCPLMITGLNDKSDTARQNAIFGLGELVLHSGEESYGSFPTILNGLSRAVAKERVPGALDTICGAISRLIITNHTLLPLDQVLPVFFSNLPLREDMEETYYVFTSIYLLFKERRDVIEKYLDQVIALTIQVLFKGNFVNSKTCDVCNELFEQMRENYPERVRVVISASSEIYAFFQAM